MLRRLVDALRRPARRLLLAAIRGYQRHLSPHKGFVCAYRVHTGRASCSALGARAVRRHGVRGGLVLLRRRTGRCGEEREPRRQRRARDVDPRRGRSSSR